MTSDPMAVTEMTEGRTELPSREFMDDGRTPNPYYDMTLDPGSGRWQPKKYFLLEDHYRVLIYRDPDSRKQTHISYSINGFSLPPLPVEEESVVPRSFAEYLDSLNYRLNAREHALQEVRHIDRDGRESDSSVTFKIAKILGPAPASESILHAIK